MNREEFDLTCSEGTAELFSNWIKNREGLAVWNSINLSNPGESWATPNKSADGSPSVKPSWQAEASPSKIITDPNKVGVCVDRVVKRFHVATERRGLSVRVSDAGSRKIKKELEMAGEGSSYSFDYGDYRNCVITKMVGVYPLPEYLSTIAEGVQMANKPTQKQEEK